MSLWIKVCGNTTLEDALLAVAAGADALGFVFAPSPRRVTLEEVAAFAAQLTAEKIGVFVDASLDEMVRTVAACGLTGVQLHGPFSAEVVAELRSRLGSEKKILRVAHFGPEAAALADAYLADPNVTAVLVDSRSATAVGGTGVAFDWQAAQQSLFQNAAARQSRLIVAGGLHPENVAEAIATLQPAGIDVASGVEAAPGRKDPAKVRAFVERARRAASSR